VKNIREKGKIQDRQAKLGYRFYFKHSASWSSKEIFNLYGRIYPNNVQYSLIGFSR